MSLLVGSEDKLFEGGRCGHLFDKLFLIFSKYLMKYLDEKVGDDKLTRFLCYQTEDDLGQV